VNTIDDFLAILRDDLGLPVTARDVPLTLDQVSGWDSLHLLSLLTLLERRTGRSLPLSSALEATSLEEIYTLAVAV
jgi:acyl carrier protein